MTYQERKQTAGAHLETRHFDRLFRMYMQWDMQTFMDQKDTLDISVYHDFAKRLDEQKQSHAPFEYVLWSTQFYGCYFDITSDVLIPRPETEQLLERVYECEIPHKARVLDMGTGSGIIAISLALQHTDAYIVATDISKPALDVCKRNIHKHRAYNVHTQIADIWDGIAGTYFDLIVANLPYVPALRDIAPANHEPHVALFGGNDGLQYYRRFFAGIYPYVRGGSVIVLEIDETQESALQDIIDNTFPNAQTSFYNDAAGFTRHVVMVI